MRIVLYTFILLLATGACTTDYGNNEKSQLVVEAWIDDGDFPVVILTRSIPVSKNYQNISDLTKYIERWARVTVSDGQHEEVLVAHADRSYFPPYYYSTSYLRGEAGKTYTLHIHCVDGTDYEAVTTIPASKPSIDSFSVEKTASSDTLYQLYAHLNPAQQSVSYYKLFTQTDHSKQSMLSSLFGVFTADMVKDGRVAVNNGRTNLKEDVNPFFSINDTVVVKIASISEEQYNYWRDFEDMASLSRNPLFPNTVNLESNVPGCIGYWFGYAARYYVVPVRKVLTASTSASFSSGR